MQTRLENDSAIGFDQLKRLSSAQYNNTIRDLFPGAELENVVFPFELSVDGFDNNVAVNTATPGLTDAYYRNAMRIGELIAEQIHTFVSCEELEQSCAEAYLLDLAARAWRRDLSTQEQESLLSDYRRLDDRLRRGRRFAAGGVLHLAGGPEFIYLPELGGEPVDLNGTSFIPLTSWEVATRLSYFVWNTTPDQELLELARQDKLRDREVITQQAWRMLGDGKAHQGVLNFYRQLLDLEKIGSNSLDFSVYLSDMEGDAGSDYLHQVLQPAMRYEPEIFVLDEVFRGTGSLAGLLTSTKTYVTPATAQLYGVEISPNTADAIQWQSQVGSVGFEYDETFYGVQLNEQERAGILTQLGFLNSHSKPVYPSPILRGVFVKDRLLCTPAPPPPGDVPALDEMDDGVAPRRTGAVRESLSQSGLLRLS